MLGPKSENEVKDSSNVNQAGRDINGISAAEHRKMLKTALKNQRSDLEAKFAESKRADTAERKLSQIEITTLRGQIAATEKKLSNPETAFAEYQSRIKELETLLEEATLEIGENRIRHAEALLAKGDESEADAIFAEVESHDKVVEAEARKRQAKAAFGRGLIAEGAVRWADAATHYARAAGLEPDLENLFKAREFAWRSGDYAAALRFGEKGITLARETGDQIDVSKSLNEHAMTLDASGRYDEAEPLYREAIEIAEATLGKEHPAYATNLNNLAELLRATGRFGEAEPLYRQAMAIREATLGKKHPDYAADLNNLALLLRAIERYDEAEPLYREAIEIAEATLGKEHPTYATNLNNLAGLLRATERFDEAEPLYRQSMAITKAKLGKDHPHYAARLNNLAVLYAQMERLDEALPLVEQALAIVESALGSEHPNTKSARQSLAVMRKAAAQ